MLPDSKITFKELTKWYLELAAVKSLSSFKRISVALSQFNAVLGHREVNSIKLEDLENLTE